MCKLSQNIATPPFVGDTGSGSSLPSGGDPTLTSTAGTTDTKFGKLLKVIAPLAGGALVGGFGGDWRQAGSGFEAEQRQQQLGIQKQELARQTQSDTFKNALDYAKAQHEMAAPPAAGAPRQYTKDVTVDGKRETHTFHREWNPTAGTWDEKDDGLAPDTSKLTPLQTTGGYVGVRESGPNAGETVPLKTPGAQPMSPMEVSSDGLPMMPPAVQREQDEEQNATAPKPEKVTSRNAQGVSTDTMIDRNPQSPTFGQQVGAAPVATRQPVPKTPRASAAPPDKGKVETYAQAILQQTKNDGDKALQAVDGLKSMPADMKAAVRARIREIQRPSGKQDVFSKYGITPGDVNKLTQQPAQ